MIYLFRFEKAINDTTDYVLVFLTVDAPVHMWTKYISDNM